MEYTLDKSLLHLLHRATQIAEDTFTGQATLGALTARQFVVLAATAANPGASQIAIAEMTGIDRSTMGDIVGRLHSKGLVARERTKRDVRAYSVNLTAAGERLLTATRPIAMDVDRRLVEAIPQGQRANFAACLRLIAKSRAAEVG